MAKLAGLANIPGYGAYIQRKQMNEQAPVQEMQQAGALLQLQQQMAQQQQDTQLKQSLAGGATIEDALEAALKSGNTAMAAKLAPIVEARKKGQPIGSGGLMKPDGTIVPPAARPPAPQAKPQIIQLMEQHDALPAGDPNKAILAQAIKKLSEHQPAVNVYSPSLTAAVDADGNPVFVQPSGQPGVAPRIVPGVRPTPKANEGLSPESAGKVAMAQQAIDGIGTIRGMLFNQEGAFNRGLAARMNLPIVSGMPGDTNARVARSAIRNAVEAKLRIETGAAATESEVERTLARFLPTVADTPESAKFKLNELEKFFKTSLSITKGIPKPKGEPDNDPLGLR